MSIKVKATAVGFYKKLRYEGDEFSVDAEKDLGKWMQRLGGADSKKAEEKSDKDPQGSKGKGGDDKQPTVKELQAQIAESEDLDFLQQCQQDGRTTVRKAADERLAKLSQG